MKKEIESLYFKLLKELIKELKDIVGNAYYVILRRTIEKVGKEKIKKLKLPKEIKEVLSEME